MIKWQWSAFDALSAGELYRIIAAREAVFVVEQNCPYLDVDGVDPDAMHLIAWDDGVLLAYMRVVKPGIKYAEPSLGRVLTSREARGRGLGRELMRRGLEQVDKLYPGMAVRISAQAYLEHFYADFGFLRVSEPYDEDGIPHLEMLKRGP
ncbi:GNAT family N-acetyltransferase [Gilvimarinus sp. F26214L]|uniref:GNAT family N-acetyltransferase n=1 Tax=Gilvimarinus sp. DZF01 TaxID=3461371 RepID=UPI0040458827